MAHVPAALRTLVLTSMMRGVDVTISSDAEATRVLAGDNAPHVAAILTAFEFRAVTTSCGLQTEFAVSAEQFPDS